MLQRAIGYYDPAIHPSYPEYFPTPQDFAGYTVAIALVFLSNQVMKSVQAPSAQDTARQSSEVVGPAQMSSSKES